MKFWLTVHYPHGDARHPWHVFLTDRHADIAQRFGKDDRVLIYETKTHRPMANGVRYPEGAEGIVVSAEVVGPAGMRPDGLAVADYADGTRATWRYGVPTEVLNREGYVSRQEVCRVLGFSPRYVFRGFGIRSSGVRELQKTQYDELLALYEQGRRPRSGTP